jgi:hypothetical protein
VSAPALCHTIHQRPRLGQKKAYAAEQQRPDVAERRSEGKAKQSGFDTDRLVFLDGSAVNTGMTRLYGRAANHQRVIEAVPDTRFHRTTIFSSIRQDGTKIPFVFEGALNGDLFRAHVTQWPAPSLQPETSGSWIIRRVAR